MSSLQLDAEALYEELRSAVRGLLQPATVLVGVWSGGAWLVERLQRDLALPGEPGVISSALHRDDFGSRGLSSGSWVRLVLTASPRCRNGRSAGTRRRPRAS